MRFLITKDDFRLSGVAWASFAQVVEERTETLILEFSPGEIQEYRSILRAKFAAVAPHDIDPIVALSAKLSGIDCVLIRRPTEQFADAEQFGMMTSCLMN